MYNLLYWCYDPVYENVDKVLEPVDNPKVYFQPIKSENPRNVTKIAGYISRCLHCGDFIIVRFRRPSRCVDCQARLVNIETPNNFHRFYRSGAWRRLRNVVFELKGKKCAYCKKLAICVDHKIPISRGGTNHFDNLQPACVYCNSQKLNKTHMEYLSVRKKPIKSLA